MRKLEEESMAQSAVQNLLTWNGIYPQSLPPMTCNLLMTSGMGFMSSTIPLSLSKMELGMLGTHATMGEQLYRVSQSSGNGKKRSLLDSVDDSSPRKKMK